MLRRRGEMRPGIVQPGDFPVVLGFTGPQHAPDQQVGVFQGGLVGGFLRSGHG